MKKIKNKLLMIISSGLFLIAIEAVSVVSDCHVFQDRVPDSLKKYENSNT